MKKLDYLLLVFPAAFLVSAIRFIFWGVDVFPGFIGLRWILLLLLSLISALLFVFKKISEL